MYLYSLYESAYFLLQEYSDTGEKIKLSVHQKNWAPIIHPTYGMFFVTNQLGPRVVNCLGSMKGSCNVAQKSSNHVASQMRSGTPYYQYPPNPQYFIAFCFYHRRNRDMWIPIFTIMKLNQDKSLVGNVPAPLRFIPVFYSEKVDFSGLTKRRPFQIMDFIYLTWWQIRISIVTSVGKWDLENDLVDVTLNFQDNRIGIMRFRGLSAYVNKIISEFERNSSNSIFASVENSMTMVDHQLRHGVLPEFS